MRPTVQTHLKMKARKFTLASILIPVTMIIQVALIIGAIITLRAGTGLDRASHLPVTPGLYITLVS